MANSARPEAAMLWFYLYCFAAMVAMTFRENRLLAFDCRTSILMPAVFLTLRHHLEKLLLHTPGRFVVNAKLPF